MHRQPNADAAVTSDAGVVLAILTADCLPVLFSADDGSESAPRMRAGAGWLPACSKRRVAAMRVPPASIVAWLGPAPGRSTTK